MNYRLKISVFVAIGAAFVATSINVAVAQKKAFTHSRREHSQGKYSNCGSCHSLPTKNWTAARPDKQQPFPDVRNFPSHASCFGCHTRDIYSSGGAFCGTCHTVPTMRARAVKPFPNRAHARQFDTIFPHDIHQDLIATTNPRTMPYAAAHFVNAAFRTDEKPKPTYYNCSICHQTSAVLPKFAVRKVTAEAALSDAVADVFAKPVTAQFFMTAPSSHASCFTCHYEFRNLPTGKQNCSGCHAPAKPYFESKAVERYSLKFDHNSTSENGGLNHLKKDCASCHVRITQNADVRTMKDADVPITSCRSCHAAEGQGESGRILTTELEKRKANSTFQCTYCHTSTIGRLQIPASHQQSP